MCIRDSYNTYYNGRTYIDEQMQVRPSKFAPEVIGNYSEGEILDYLSDPSYTFYSNATKSKIGECKNCELRTMCTDNRLPIMLKMEIVYESKCKYDQLLGEWVY